MKTVVMTGGTAGFGAVAAKRISNTPNTKLILGARDNESSSIDILPMDWHVFRMFGPSFKRSPRS